MPGQVIVPAEYGMGEEYGKIFAAMLVCQGSNCGLADSAMPARPPLPLAARDCCDYVATRAAANRVRKIHAGKCGHLWALWALFLAALAQK